MGNIAVWIILVIVVVLLIFWVAWSTSEDDYPYALQFNAAISGSQEVPPVRTEGNGQATVVLNSDRDQINYTILVRNLSSPILDGHFHRGSAGQNGPIVRTLQFREGNYGYSVAQGSWTTTDEEDPLTDAIISDLIRGNLYVNVHTRKHTSGEIRGQILPVY